MAANSLEVEECRRRIARYESQEYQYKRKASDLWEEASNFRFGNPELCADLTRLAQQQYDLAQEAGRNCEYARLQLSNLLGK